jgi:hypothetical protein
VEEFLRVFGRVNLPRGLVLTPETATALGFKKTLYSSGCFALDGFSPTTYYFHSRMVKSAGSASAKVGDNGLSGFFIRRIRTPQTLPVIL